MSLEAGRFHTDLLNYLKKQEYRLDKQEDFAFYLGCVQAVVQMQSQKGFQGIADIRRDGTVQ